MIDTYAPIALRIASVLLENARTLLFSVGFVLLYAGVSGWSYRAANVTAGVVLMVVAVVPYLRYLRRVE